LCWIKRKGATTQRKIFPKKIINEMQKKVDKLNIIKGFPKGFGITRLSLQKSIKGKMKN
jgi:hypothetical protein